MMRLSDAILLGSTLRPQGFGRLFSGLEGHKGSCALGAAVEASGLGLELDACDLIRVWPFLADQSECPHCHGRDGQIIDVIIYLNDAHHWTRERIAEWVATIEPAEAPVQEPNASPAPLDAAVPVTLERAETRDQRDGAVAQADAAPIFKH